MRLSLAGRWRAHLIELPRLDAAATDALLRLEDHVHLRLGERNLTAHLEEESVIPLLGALAGGLDALTSGAASEARVRLPRSRHLLRLSRAQGVLRVSLEAETGRFVVRDEPFDPASLRRSLRDAARDIVQAVGAAVPEAGRLCPVRALAAVLTPRGGRRCAEERSAEPTPPPSRGDPGAGRRPALSIEPDAEPGGARRLLPVRVRLGGRPPISLALARPLDTLEALVTCVEALLKTRDWPSGRWDVAFDGAPSARLVLQRDPNGLTARVLDRAGHERLERTRLDPSGLATTVARFARRLDALPPHVDLDRDRLRRLLRTLRGLGAWARALTAGDRLEAEVAVPPPPCPPAARPAPEPLPIGGLRHLAYRQRWRRHVPGLDAGHIGVAGDRLVAHGHDGVVALEGASGRTVWQRPGAGPLAQAPPGLLVSTGGRLLHVDLADGRLQWRARPFRGDRHVTHACAIEGGFFVAAEDGALAALDARHGRVRWRARTFHGGVTGVAAAGDLVWANGEDGFVHGWSVSTGRRVFAALHPGDLQGAPRFEGSGLLVVANVGPEAAGRVSSLHPTTGARRWSLALDGTAAGPPVVAGSTLLLGVEGPAGPRLHAFDVDAGHARWDAPVGGDAPRSVPLAVGALAFIKGTDGRVVALDLHTGEERWSAPADDPGEVLVRNAPPALCRGLLLVPGQTIRALAPSDGRLVHVLSCGDLVPEWMHVWPDGDLVVAEGDAITRYLLGGHLAVVE